MPSRVRPRSSQRESQVGGKGLPLDAVKRRKFSDTRCGRVAGPRATLYRGDHDILCRVLGGHELDNPRTIARPLKKLCPQCVRDGIRPGAPPISACFGKPSAGLAAPGVAVAIPSDSRATRQGALHSPRFPWQGHRRWPMSPGVERDHDVGGAHSPCRRSKPAGMKGAVQIPSFPPSCRRNRRGRQAPRFL